MADEAGAPRAEPWLASGEMLYRGGLDGLARAELWKTVLEPFAGLIGAPHGHTAVQAKRAHDLAEKDLSAARDCARRLRENRLRSMTARLRKVEAQAEHVLGALECHEEATQERVLDRQRALDRALLEECARFAALVERECEVVSAHVARAGSSSDAKLADLERSLRMEEFALHLEHETDGQVLLRRLSPDNPQYVRCRRATCENVKSEFFGPTSRFSGVSVLDVFKVENKPMLGTFQRRVASLKPGAVKGLFCSVSEAALETIIVQGMRSPQEAAGAPAVGHALFTRANYTPSEVPGATDGLGVAEARFVNADPVAFPATFSRFSTLESDRQRMFEGNGAEDAPPRYLALCRVIVGEVFRTSKDYKGFPAISSGGGKFDSMYSAAQDEYLLLNSALVLPEFLIRFRYRGRGSGGGGGGPQGSATAPATPTPTPTAPGTTSSPPRPRRAVEVDLSAASAPPAPPAPPAPTPMLWPVPQSVSVPGAGPARSRADEAPARDKFVQHVESAEAQVGPEALRNRAAKQREQVWARVAELLVRGTREACRDLAA